MTISAIGAQAQIGVGTTTPHPSAMLHISAGAGNNKGLIMPKIASGSRVVLDSTQNIAPGLVFFDTDLQKFYYFHQSPRQWFELDHDWIRKDVAGASPVVGTHIYSGVPGNVGIGTAANVNPGSKLTIVGNLAVGTAAYTQDSVAQTNGVTFGTWLGVGTRTQTSGTIFNVKGNSRVQGDEVVTGQVTANRFSGEGIVPTGGIIMWSGTVTGNFSGGLGTGEYIGWALCDGRNGTPDLRGRFIVGMRNGLGNGPYVNTERNRAEYVLDGFGGKAFDTITTPELPAHSHSGTTASSGSHTHNYTGPSGCTNGVFSSSGGCYMSDTPTTLSTASTGSHTHSFTTGDTGGDVPTDNRPPYYVLAFIMKLP